MPLGLDKLRGSLNAERQRRFPPFCLSENEKHGETYSQYSGGQYVIITRDPRNIRAVLSTQFEDFHYGSVRKGCFHPLLGEGIFTNDGEKWMRSRRQLAPIFHTREFPSLNTLERHVQILLDRIKHEADADHSGGAVDIQQLFYLFSFDSATEFLLGRSAETLSQNIHEDGFVFSQSFHIAVRWLATRERFKMFYWLVDGIEFRQACRAAKTALERIVQRTADNGQSMIHHMLLSEKGNPTEVRDEVMNVLFAGRDTVSSLLSWTFYSLAREPETYSRLRDEIVDAIGLSREPQSFEINRMQYLDCVINETLRLFPAVPLNGRLCRQDTTLPAGGGENGECPILVPKGTLICYHTYATQRAKHLFGHDADEYRPERWFERTKKEMTMNWTFHPFSGGPRKCLGGTLTHHSSFQLFKYLFMPHGLIFPRKLCN